MFVFVVRFRSVGQTVLETLHRSFRTLGTPMHVSGEICQNGEHPPNRDIWGTPRHPLGWAESFPHSNTLSVCTHPDSCLLLSSLDPCVPPSCICKFGFLTLRGLGRARRPGGNVSARRQKQKAISTRF